MESFFAGMAPETALELAGLSREMFDLRESRKRLLADAGCADAADLLTAVREGRLSEHPGYEAWLDTVLLQRREQALRSHIDECCRNIDGAPMAHPPLNPLSALVAELAVPAAFTDSLRIHPDGIAFNGADDLDALLRIESAHAWSFEWRLGEARWRLDNAPVRHAGIATTAHLHRPGGVVADPLALDGSDGIGTVLQCFLDALAASPVW